MIEGTRHKAAYAYFVRTTPRQSLILFLATGFVLAVVSLGYLAALPSDSSDPFLGRFSAARVILMAGPFLLAAACGGFLVWALGHRPWSERVGRVLVASERGLHRFVAAGIGIAATAFMLVVLYQPGWIQGMNEARLQRLLPYFLVPLGLLAGLWLVRRLATRGIALAVTSFGLDLACGVFLFIVALVARYALTGFALPYTGVWDEVVTYAPALARVGGDELVVDKNISVWGRAGYGELPIGLTTVAEVVGFIDGLRTQRVHSIEEFISPSPGVATIWEGVQASGIPLRYPRTVFAVLNSLGPPLVFLGLRRYLGAQRGPALAGGLLLALRSRDVLLYSPYILPDALAMTLSIGVVLCSLEIIQDRRGSLKWYLLAGVFAGLASAAVLRYLILAAVPVFALLLARNRSRPLAKLALIAGGAVGGFLLTSPGFLTDLPRQLVRLSANDWEHSLSVANRAQSLVFYLKGMFDDNFVQYWFNFPQVGAGLGVLTLGVALVGSVWLVATRPRAAAVLLGLTLAYLWWLSPIQSRATRHALVLYPLACMLAGCGLQAIADGIKSILETARRRRQTTDASAVRGTLRLSPWLPGMVAGAFLLLSVEGFHRSLSFVTEIAGYETPQKRMADFLEAELEPGEKVGILDIMPFDLAELYRRKIPFERIRLEDTIDDLQRRGLAVVVGTDLTSGEYPSIAGTIWDIAFDDPGDRIAEFGEQALLQRGEPKPNLYLFAARVPKSDP